LLCERKGGFDGGETRSELQHEPITRRAEHPSAARRGDAFDHAPERRHFGRGLRLIGFSARGVARNVQRDDRGESAGLGILSHELSSDRVGRDAVLRLSAPGQPNVDLDGPRT